MSEGAKGLSDDDFSFIERMSLVPSGKIEEGEESGQEGWVSIQSVIGTVYIPESAAKVIAEAVARMKANEEVTDKNLWQALEYMAAEYLSGA